MTGTRSQSQTEDATLLEIFILAMNSAAMSLTPSSVEKGEMDFPDLGTLEIGAPLTLKKGAGARMSPLAGSCLKIILGSEEEPLRVPFEAANFDKSDTSTRVNLNYELTDTKYQAFVEMLDETVIGLLAARSAEFFRKSLSADQIRLMYKPCLCTTPPYNPTLKTKVCIGDEAQRVVVWSPEGEQIDIPTSFRNLRVVTQIALKSVWSTSSMCGLTLQTEHLMLSEHEVIPVFPFQAVKRVRTEA